jgi:hypothetical protein
LTGLVAFGVEAVLERQEGNFFIFGDGSNTSVGTNEMLTFILRGMFRVLPPPHLVIHIHRQFLKLQPRQPREFLSCVKSQITWNLTGEQAINNLIVIFHVETHLLQGRFGDTDRVHRIVYALRFGHRGVELQARSYSLRCVGNSNMRKARDQEE